MLKKWIALALTLATVLSVLPFAAFAEQVATEALDAPAETTAPTETTAAPTETTAGQTSAEQPAVPEAPKEEEKPKPKLEPLSPAQAAMPTNKLPTKAARIARLRYLIQWDYQNALEQEDRESLYGFCGLLASYQMYYRGINTWRLCYDGKDNFDAFSKMGMTDGGYTIRSYNALKEPPKEEEKKDEPAQETIPAVTEPTQPTEAAVPPESTAPAAAETTAVSETTETTAALEDTAVPEAPAEPEKYTIAEILNRITNNGSKEVYNLLVCFDKTDTAAGTIYGHVLFVYGIIDGTVYFTEGGNMFGVEAGEPMECSIAQFSASYATWTDFEGVIVFGNKDYLDNCTVRTCSMFATCTRDVALLPLPDVIENGTIQRTAAKGERLQVVGLYQNRDGEYYYEIYDDGKIGYAATDGLEAMLFLYEPYNTEELVLPQVVTPGKDVRLDGKVRTDNYMSQVRVAILDDQGNVLQQFVKLVNDSQYDLDDWNLNKALDFGALPEGVYTLKVETTASNWYMYRGYRAKDLCQETVTEQLFAVGKDVEIPVMARQLPPPPVKDGWIYENRTWYCFEEGTPVTGWKQEILPS